MNERDKDLVRYRLERSARTFEVAEGLVADDKSFDAVNRMYYACFYAFVALLITAGKESRKHSGVRDLLNIEFVRCGDVSVESGRFYGQLFKHRQRGDYDDFVEFTADQVRAWLERARIFVDEIQRLTRARMENS